MPIPPRLRRILLQRGLTLWILARVIAMGMVAVASSGSGRASTLLVPLWSMTMCCALLLVDLHRRKELVLLHNLGVTTGRALSIGVLPSLVLEILLVVAFA